MKEKIERRDILILATMILFMGIGALLNVVFLWSDSIVTISEEIGNPTWVYCILGVFGGVCIYMPILLLVIEVKRIFHKS